VEKMWILWTVFGKTQDTLEKAGFFDILRKKDFHIFGEKYPQILTDIKSQKFVDIVDN